MALTRHTITGKIEEVPDSLVDHAWFGQYLEVVDEDAKPFAEGLFHSGTVEERAETHPDTPAETESKVLEEPEVPLRAKASTKDKD